MLSHLGDGKWSSTKKAAEKSIYDYAAKLLKIQAVRETHASLPFGADGPWQKEFEDTFPYKETGDQLLAINDTKADMESAKPMDRLICGDVGFGKTEIAIRAAFKAAAEGRQVAMLVPTTVLAQQHFENFSPAHGHVSRRRRAAQPLSHRRRAGAGRCRARRRQRGHRDRHAPADLQRRAFQTPRPAGSGRGTALSASATRNASRSVFPTSMCLRFPPRRFRARSTSR